MDMKCHASSCWYCKDLCEHCLSPSSFGPGLTAQSATTGFSLRFCSQECAQYFTGSDEKPILLDIEILPPRNQHDSEQSIPNVLLQITGSGMLKMDEGFKVICLVCHGYHSEEYPSGRFFVLCQLRSLFSQKIFEMFVSDEGIPEEPLPHADCPPGHKLVTSSKNSGSITPIIISALQSLQELIGSKCEEGAELKLIILKNYQSILFETSEVNKSIKVCMQF